ncbi:MAG TPA: metallophosphoesterase [Candidatus Limnocylindrales bacterium]|nr:metallophosphoesterase [Candidatus Limnocylindrales bacterium]
MRRLPVIVTIAALAAVFLPFSNVFAADPVLVGAGDIASCSRSQDTATARLVGSISGTVFTAGDNVYTHGSASEFTNCYGPTWGQYKSRTRPAAGDEDYETAGAKGYLGYFGSRAAPSGKTYYSYSIGAWHAVVLDTDCSDVGGCGSTSPQANWLRSDLAANPTACTIAIFHHPRFSSAQSKPDGRSVTFWQILYQYGADVIVSGHRHQYERFAPQTPSGGASSKGIREFVVGTGGAALAGFSTVAPNSQVRNSSTYGVLKLTLHSSSYDFAFVPIAGQSFRDSGSASCHGKP